MRYYEVLYIINSNLEDDKVKSIIDEIGNEIEKNKVSVINHHFWGKKRLAYSINNHKYGTYILLQFGADKVDFLTEFERFLILNKSVIRHQIIKLDKVPAKVEKEKSAEIVEDENSLEVEAFEASIENERPEFEVAGEADEQREIKTEELEKSASEQKNKEEDE